MDAIWTCTPLGVTRSGLVALLCCCSSGQVPFAGSPRGSPTHPRSRQARQARRGCGEASDRAARRGRGRGRVLSVCSAIAGEANLASEAADLAEAHRSRRSTSRSPTPPFPALPRTASWTAGSRYPQACRPCRLAGPAPQCTIVLCTVPCTAAHATRALKHSLLDDQCRAGEQHPACSMAVAR